jgi:hypothetical protein
MPGHTTAQVIDKLEEFLAQDIKGEDIDEFCCDNDACFTDEFKRWAHKKDWKLHMSATYKQHQNAVAEALWAKLKPMTSINISSNPELGYQWWDRVMVHANHTAQYWPCKANPGMHTATPMGRWTGTAVTPTHLKPWGACGYVYEQVGGIKLKGVKCY